MTSGDTTRDSTGVRATGLGVALLTLVLVVANVAERYHTSTWILRDGRFYVNVLDGIVERGSLEDVYARSWYSGEHGWNYNLPASFSNVAVGRNGEHYSFRPWLLPVLSTPLYFAFGLLGTLIFNVLMFAPIAWGAFRYGRRFARDASSAAVGALFLAFGTGLAFYQYDFHVDVLLIALLICAFGASVHRGSYAVGALFALCLLIKPTTITILPALCVPMIERRDAKAFGRAVLGGALVIGIGALMNSMMFGRPWWFGYNRVLIVEAGQPGIADDLDAFVTPFDQGIRELWGGYFGLSTRWTAFLVAAAPGIPYVLIKRPVYALVALATAFVNVMIFARFEYIGERYLLPTACVLLPFVVGTFETIRAASRGRLPAPAIVAGSAALLVAISSLPFNDPVALDERAHRASYSLGARALAAGSLDVRAIDPHPRTADPLTSPIARSRFGDWMARSSPAAVLLATPFVAFGDAGIFALHFLAVFLAAFAGARLLGRAIHPAIAAAAMTGIALLPVVRDALAPGGTMLLASAAALFAAERAMGKRFAMAAIFAVLAAWIADAPWLVIGFVAGLAALDSRRAFYRTLAWTAGALALWAIVTLILIGRPFASPDEFVVWTDGSIENVASVPREMSLRSFYEAIATSVAQCTFETRDPAARGALLPLLLFGPFGLALAWRRGRLIALVALLAAPFLFASARTAEAYVALALFAAIPLALGAHTVSKWLIDHYDRRRALVAALAVLAVLFGAGAVRRAGADEWRLSSERVVREADVHLGDVPCDFLAWEHYAWECATFDGGPNGVTGLNTCSSPAIDGVVRPLFVVPTSDRRRAPRTVRWENVPSGTLVLEYGVPDGGAGGASVVVRSNGEEERFEIPLGATGMIGERRIEVREYLEIEVASLGGRATIAFDGVVQRD